MNEQQKDTLFKYLKERSKTTYNGCIEFTNTPNPDGYSVVAQGTLLAKLTGEKFIHRAAYTLAYGKIPKNMCVLHTCDNRKCFNIQHLWLGTRDDNNKDRAMKKRSANVQGENSHTCKLTKENVILIRKLQGYISATDLGKALDIHLSTICKIWNKQLWSPLP